MAGFLKLGMGTEIKPPYFRFKPLLPYYLVRGG